MDRIRLTAVTKVTRGGLIYPPGATLDVPRPIADALLAGGAARPLDDPPPDAHDDAPAEDRALERVSGIGPITARALRSAGVADLAALAALSDDAIATLALDAATQAKMRADWRAHAAALVQDTG